MISSKLANTLKPLLMASLSLAALLSSACDPKNGGCPAGTKAMLGACVPSGSAGAGAGSDAGPKKHMKDAGAGMADDAGAADAAANSCPDPYAGFGKKCSADTECSCGAPTCATTGLLYCTRLNCMGDPKACPPKWTCLDISAQSPDPNVKSICFGP